MEKYEWRKSEKDVYIEKERPRLIEIKKYKFFTLEGKGNPNGKEFSEKVEALYTMAYGVRMSHKGEKVPKGYFEYTVYPLEGIWKLKEEGVLNKEELSYKIMIRQPDFVLEELFKSLQKEKGEKNKYIKDVKFEIIEDGLAVQMMHIGPFENESETFNIMENFCRENRLKIKKELGHREIYISNIKRVKRDKLKTVLRIFCIRNK